MTTYARPQIKRQDRTGQDRTGQDRTGQDRKGKERKGKERKGKERKGKEKIRHAVALQTGIKRLKHGGNTAVLRS